jgi:phosphoglycolate phosphatase
MNSVLSRLGLPTHAIDDYRYFVGQGIENLVKSVVPKNHLDDHIVYKFLSAMKIEYARHCCDNTKPYPGIRDLLTALDTLALPKAVLSNKSDYLTQIMVTSLLSPWSFEVVRGLKPPIPPKPDPTAALQIASELKIHPQRFLYLGDSGIDMQTANATGMHAAGALWGFRTAEELRANGAKVLVETPQAVLELLE